MQVYIKILLTIFLGLLLGGGLVLLHISSNGSLQEHIVKRIQKDFYEKYGCKLDCRLEKIDWFPLRMRFVDVSINTDCDGLGRNHNQDYQEGSSWSIVADSLTISISWFSLITRFRCRISGAFERVVMYEHQISSLPGKEASSELAVFLSKLFKRSSSSFIEYDWLAISDGLLFFEQSDGSCVHVPYICNISCEASGTRMQFYAQRGKVFHQGVRAVEEITGSLVWHLPVQDVAKEMYVQMSIDMRIVALMEKGLCNLAGSMKHGQGRFSLKNEDNSFIVDPIQIRIDSKKCLFDTSVITNSDLCNQLKVHDFFKDVQGAIKIDFRGDLYDILNTVQIDMSVDNVLYKSKNIFEKATALVHYVKPGLFAGMIAVSDKQFFEFTIKSNQNRVKVECINNRDFILPGDSCWKIPVGKCILNVDYDKKIGWSGDYSVLFKNEKKQEEKSLLGRCVACEQKVLLNGRLDDILYDINMALSPSIMLEKFLITQHDKNLVRFHVDEKNSSVLLGNIDFACIQYIVPEAFKSSFSQEGAVQFQGSVKDGIYYSQVSTNKANIRIPKIYNVVQNIAASCELDFYNRRIAFKDVKAELHEGEIVCSNINLFFEKSGKVQFIHAPCLLHNVLVSWNKGIFSLFSGSMLVSKFKDEPIHIAAQIIVEKSQLKDNIFSSEFQEALFGRALEYDDKENAEDSPVLDIAVFTKELLRIKTAFLGARAKLDLHLKGTAKKPELSGVIHLVSGSFYFPYKPLDISDGKIFFFPDQQFDPLLDVVAKAKLKRFGVSMHVTGSVFDPVVQFDAAPYLTEEQIVSLLLLGIEENSLSVMVSALLTQKLKDLVFGPALSKTKLQSKFERLLQSLKYFRFLPQFTNQTGRGGIRGLFEVDASDHLHGKVDTNFMQLEDTKFDVNYDVTDDVTLRGQKDGPSTYGGEIEFRWKFG